MQGESKHDIHIGKTQRIHWVEFDSSGNDFEDVDYMIAKHSDFWTALQINCVAECCGLDAFSFYPDDIIQASTGIDKAALKEDLVQIKLDLFKSEKDIIVSSTLNTLMNKGVFIALVDHILRYL